MKRDSSSLVTTLVEEYVHNYKLSLGKEKKKDPSQIWGVEDLRCVFFDIILGR